MTPENRRRASIKLQLEDSNPFHRTRHEPPESSEHSDVRRSEGGAGIPRCRDGRTGAEAPVGSRSPLGGLAKPSQVGRPAAAGRPATKTIASVSRASVAPVGQQGPARSPGDIEDCSSAPLGTPRAVVDSGPRRTTGWDGGIGSGAWGVRTLVKI